VVKPEDADALMEIFEKYELPHAVIGKVTDSSDLVIKQNREVIAKVGTYLLADPPVIERASCNPRDEGCGEGEIVEYQKLEDIDPKEAVLKLLGSPNIASKKWVYSQYDHEVLIRTVVKPGDDAAVLRIDDEKAIALTSDCNSIHTKLDPYHGGAGAVAEAFRNVVSVGAEPVCIVDCLNFGNPEKPHVFWQFKECIKGMSDIAKRFNVPVISGNVSFYNETEGVTVNPSPVVGVAGLMDIKDIKTMDFKNEADKIIIIGKTGAELDGSEYHKTIHGVVQGKPPHVDMDMEFESANAVLKLIRNDNEGSVTAVHDCSSGGLATAVAEMAISGGIGAVLDTSKVPKENSKMSVSEILFSESNARFIVTVKSEAAEKLLEKIDAPAAIIGEVRGNKLIIDEIVDLSLEELKESYYGVIDKFMA
jgi:phosphoribosylformylglycinamidine synthase